MAYSKEYDDLAKQIANEVFYPENPELALIFYRMIKQESGFDLDVIEGRRVSSAGAVGIAQFMPATAKERGVDPLNPEDALRAAALYLKDLIAYHGGDVEKGVASYNCGPGTVDKACQQGTGDWKSLLPAETQTYLQVVGLLGGMAGQAAQQAGQAGLGGFASAGGQAQTAGQGTGLTPGQWVEQAGIMPAAYGADWENPQPGERGDYWISQQMPEYRKWIFEQYSSAMGLSEADVPAWEREETEARTAVNWANAERIIRELGGDTYEDKRQEFLDMIDQKQWTAEQAIREFNAWMPGALEAGRRAETVYGEEMKRAEWTTPTEYFPGTEKGGAREQFSEKYGVPYTSSPGIPTSQLPNPEQMYATWHQNMGISEQAPPTQGGWSGQGAGQGAPGNAAQAFLSQLRQRYAPQFEAGRA